MRRRERCSTGVACARRLGPLGLVLVLAAAAVSPPAAAATRRATTQVQRGDLVERENVGGTLGYGTTSTIASPRSGVLTRLPAAGSVIERGQVLFDVNAEPVPLVYGSIPPYRDLAAGVSDGADVTQLEENLVALGYGVTVDERFDSATAAALRQWQSDLGVDQTGRFTRTDAVVSEGPVRIAQLKAAKGASVGPGQPVMDVTGTVPVVTVRLEVARQTLAEVGAPARVVLPDNREIGARVASVGTVASKESENTSAKIDVTVALDNPADAGTLTAAPVTVRFTRQTASGVLFVPVGALLALSEGGYAVETVRRGVHQLVAVELGAFADGNVEIRGALKPGTRVVVPA